MSLRRTTKRQHFLTPVWAGGWVEEMAYRPVDLRVLGYFFQQFTPIPREVESGMAGNE